METEKLFGLDAVMMILAFLGLVICLYIHKKKRSGERLVCPIGHDCNDVLNSRFSKTFGFRNEAGGMIYYGFAAIVYFYLMLNIPIAPIVLALLLLSTLGAFMFSIYLIIVQAFILKKWCVWCVSSALISTALFILSFWKLLP